MSANNVKILRIDGLPEAVSFLTSFPNSLSTKLDTELNSIGDRGASTIKNNAHRLTGKMANSVAKKKSGKLKVSIDVPVGYAGHENKRGNPHNFFDKGVAEITKDAQNRIPAVIDGLIGSKGK
jgi:hypothetical protein